MNSIEEDLKKALRRKEPSADFASKVMDLASAGAGFEPESPPRPSKVLFFRLKPKVVLWLATAAAAACVLGLFIARSYVADRGKVVVTDTGSAATLPRQLATPEPGAVQTNPAGPASEGKEVATGPTRIGTGAWWSPVHHSRVGSHRNGAGTGVPEEARRAEEQLRIALSIASAKLGYAQRSIQEADGTDTVDKEVSR